MTLRDLVKADAVLGHALGLAEPCRLTSPEGVTTDVNLQVFDVGLGMDAEERVAVVARSVHATCAIADLPDGLSSVDGALWTVTREGGETMRVLTLAPDRTNGIAELCLVEHESGD